jgi:hypothetical protein
LAARANLLYMWELTRKMKLSGSAHGFVDDLHIDVPVYTFGLNCIRRCGVQVVLPNYFACSEKGPGGLRVVNWMGTAPGLAFCPRHMCNARLQTHRRRTVPHYLACLNKIAVHIAERMILVGPYLLTAV